MALVVILQPEKTAHCALSPLQLFFLLRLELLPIWLVCALLLSLASVISQLSLEPTPHHAVAQYDYMGTALLKICMTFMLLYPMVAAQCLPYSIYEQL